MKLQQQGERDGDGKAKVGVAVAKYGHCSWICSSSVGAFVVTLFALLTPSETECTIRARFDKAFSLGKAALWPLTSSNSDVPGCYRIS